jgi:hypothetical protein
MNDLLEETENAVLQGGGRHSGSNNNLTELLATAACQLHMIETALSVWP